jgi:hypothetical protein
MVACAASLAASCILSFCGHGVVETIRVRFVADLTDGKVTPCSAATPHRPNHALMYVAPDLWDDGFVCGTCHVIGGTGDRPLLAYVAGNCPDCSGGSVAISARYSVASSLHVRRILTRTRCPKSAETERLLVTDHGGDFATVDFAPLGDEAGNVMEVEVSSERGREHLKHAYAAIFQLPSVAANASISLTITDGFKTERTYACTRRGSEMTCTRQHQSAPERHRQEAPLGPSESAQELLRAGAHSAELRHPSRDHPLPVDPVLTDTVVVIE